jgi:chlorophyllide a reductase subunit Z
VPASFPGAIIRRHTGSPVMGYSGATWVVQEYCNALFDALFHVLPLARELDAIEATPGRALQPVSWESAARERLEALIAAEPVLVRISAAKRMRDMAEADARAAGGSEVTAARLTALFGMPREDVPA